MHVPLLEEFRLGIQKAQEAIVPRLSCLPLTGDHRYLVQHIPPCQVLFIKRQGTMDYICVHIYPMFQSLKII